MPRSNSRAYVCDTVVVGSVWGSFEVIATSGEGVKKVTDVKCTHCGTVQTNLRAQYIVKKAKQNYRKGCYACWRSTIEREVISAEQAAARRTGYWKTARNKIKTKAALDPEYKEKLRAQAHAQWNRLSWLRQRLTSLKPRALRAGVAWEYDAIEGMEVPTVCPVLGIPLIRGVQVLSMNSPSIDRIVPERGYVKGNLQVISQLANGMKQNATPEQLRAFAKWVTTTYGDTDA